MPSSKSAFTRELLLEMFCCSDSFKTEGCCLLLIPSILFVATNIPNLSSLTATNSWENTFFSYNTFFGTLSTCTAILTGISSKEN